MACGSTNGTPAGGARPTAAPTLNTRASISSVMVSRGGPSPATLPSQTGSHLVRISLFWAVRRSR